ncbi:hypothetical protein DL98DRAFT_586024 [Cadophora sp. DSE1049]|nr:hypothetical protein DL98DRAFT_586024 [Cadophora sp. DSE1049]
MSLEENSLEGTRPWSVYDNALTMAPHGNDTYPTAPIDCHWNSLLGQEMSASQPEGEEFVAALRKNSEAIIGNNTGIQVEFTNGPNIFHYDAPNGCSNLDPSIPHERALGAVGYIHEEDVLGEYAIDASAIEPAPLNSPRRAYIAHQEDASSMVAEEETIGAPCPQDSYLHNIQISAEQIMSEIRRVADLPATMTSDPPNQNQQPLTLWDMCGVRYQQVNPPDKSQPPHSADRSPSSNCAVGPIHNQNEHTTQALTPSLSSDSHSGPQSSPCSQAYVNPDREAWTQKVEAHWRDETVRMAEARYSRAVIENFLFSLRPGDCKPRYESPYQHQPTPDSNASNQASAPASVIMAKASPTLPGGAIPIPGADMLGVSVKYDYGGEIRAASLALSLPIPTSESSRKRGRDDGGDAESGKKRHKK